MYTESRGDLNYVYSEPWGVESGWLLFLYYLNYLSASPKLMLFIVALLINLAYVFLAKKYESTGYDLEDLVSIGSLGLIKGIMTYKIDKNIKLATYASRCITNEILMYIRKNKNRKWGVKR